MSASEAGKDKNAFSLSVVAEVLDGAVAERLPRPMSASEAGKDKNVFSLSVVAEVLDGAVAERLKAAVC